MSIITISRGTFSGGKMLAECLAERLQYQCISRELIMETSKRYGVTRQKLYDALVNAPSILERMTFERDQYLAFLQAVLSEMVKNDNVVYHGFAGQFLLKGIQHVLRVRIIADINFRIRLAMDKQNFSEKEAMDYLIKMDKQREKWTKFLYGADWKDPAIVDLVINLESISIPMACEIIRHTVQQPDFRTTADSQRHLENLILASKVKAALATDPKIHFTDFHIEADHGNVIISGKTKSQSTLDYITDLIKKVEGVKDITTQPNEES